MTNWSARSYTPSQTANTSSAPTTLGRWSPRTPMGTSVHQGPAMMTNGGLGSMFPMVPQSSNTVIGNQAVRQGIQPALTNAGLGGIDPNTIEMLTRIFGSQNSPSQVYGGGGYGFNSLPFNWA